MLQIVVGLEFAYSIDAIEEADTISTIVVFVISRASALILVMASLPFIIREPLVGAWLPSGTIWRPVKTLFGFYGYNFNLIVLITVCTSAGLGLIAKWVLSLGG